MIIRVSELSPEGLDVRDARQFSTPAFTDPEWRLDGVDLHVQPDGDDVTVQGTIEATVPLACGRCLESLPTHVNVLVDVRLTPRPAARDDLELGADDLDTDFYANDELDLGALIQTETTLALPMKPLCREDCRGLCPACGMNRNLTPCECREQKPDPRLAVLSQWSARRKG
ncbi:MAG: DUF177 domain-containing protein [Candidatus Rokuibacteriota bacterium]|nr:MAG: DUF177 domain-containing protein [Candidatus Rokubacteria bacterium]